MDGFVQLLWTISWQVALVAGFVWLVSRGSASVPAAWRYALWVMVVAKFLVPPFAYLPSHLAFWQTRHQPQMVTAPTEPAHLIPISSSPSAAAQAPRPAGADRVTDAPHALALPDTVSILAGIWAVGVLAVAMRLGARYRRQAGLIRNSLPADEEVSGQLRECASRLGMRRLPAVRFAGDITTPMVVGLLRPAVVLPTGITESCRRSDIAAILMHELAHVRRWDMAVVWLHQIVQALFFFHPAAWIAGPEIGRERELACDELVLSTTGVDRREYAAGYLSRTEAGAERFCKGDRPRHGRAVWHREEEADYDHERKYT